MPCSLCMSIFVNFPSNLAMLSKQIPHDDNDKIYFTVEPDNSFEANVAILSHNIAILIGRLSNEQFTTDANKLLFEIHNLICKQKRKVIFFSTFNIILGTN